MMPCAIVTNYRTVMRQRWLEWDAVTEATAFCAAA